MEPEVQPRRGAHERAASRAPIGEAEGGVVLLQERVDVVAEPRSVTELERDGSIAVAVGPYHCRLAILPDVTFFTRYHEVFP